MTLRRVEAGWGTELTPQGWAWLHDRLQAVFDEHGTVIYSHISPEISQEPDYDSAMAALS